MSGISQETLTRKRGEHVLQATAVRRQKRVNVVSSSREWIGFETPTHCTPSCPHRPCAKGVWQLCGSCNIALHNESLSSGLRYLHRKVTDQQCRTILAGVLPESDPPHGCSSCSSGADAYAMTGVRRCTKNSSKRVHIPTCSKARMHCNLARHSGRDAKAAYGWHHNSSTRP